METFNERFYIQLILQQSNLTHDRVQLRIVLSGGIEVYWSEFSFFFTHLSALIIVLT
jgi:hypothetical protein